jgi:hypothetical protein
MSTLTLKIATLYAAYLPELGVVSYGSCSDEALNNLTEEITERQGKESSAFLLTNHKPNDRREQNPPHNHQDLG